MKQSSFRSVPPPYYDLVKPSLLEPVTMCPRCGRAKRLIGSYCTTCTVALGTIDGNTIGTICNHGDRYPKEYDEITHTPSLLSINVWRRHQRRTHEES